MPEDSPKLMKGVARLPRLIKVRKLWRRSPRKVLLVAAVLIVIMGISGWLGWEYSRPLGQNTNQLVEGNGYQRAIDDLQTQALPNDPLDRVFYYSQLGQNYEALGQYKRALENYEKAQQTIDTGGLANRLSMYTPVADMHEQLGDKTKAREYRQKAQDAYERNKHLNDNVPQNMEAKLE